MRTIVLWFRQIFCKHNWIYEEYETFETNTHTNAVTKRGIKVSRTCKNCGWHKSYWKY